MHKIIDETIVNTYLYTPDLVQYYEIVERIVNGKRTLRKQKVNKPEDNVNYREKADKDRLFFLLLDQVDTSRPMWLLDGLENLSNIVNTSNLSSNDLLAVVENHLSMLNTANRELLLENGGEDSPYANWHNLTDYERYPERYKPINVDDLYTEEGGVKLEEQDSSLFNMVVNTEE